MNINIKATKTTLTPSIKTYIEEKLETLEKFIKPEDKIHVEIEVVSKKTDEPSFRADIDIQPHGHYAEAKALDVYAAIDMVIPKIKAQLAKLKDKKVSARRERVKFNKIK
jgi:putative sigma-54 modulation protein